MRHLENELAVLSRSVIEPMGYELVGVEYFRRSKGSAVLRVYIDRPDGGPKIDDKEKGITLDDCSLVSHQLSGVLDVEDPITGHYDLEVSSPGLDRPLFTAEHFQRFRGRRASIKLATKFGGRRNLQGQIAGLKEEAVLLVVDGEAWEIPLGVIESARLIPEY